MARYTYGGGIAQLVVSPDAALGGALKAAPGTTLTLYNLPVGSTGRAIVTDFLVGGVATTSIVTDATGYPPEFQGPDGMRPLYDAGGRRFDPHDSADVPVGSTAQAGVLELATLAEVTTGTDAVRAVTPQGVRQESNAHLNAAQSHPDYSASIDQMSTALGAKADLVSGQVARSQIPKATTATPETIADRRTNGALAAAAAQASDELVRLDQANALFGSSGASGADVRFRRWSGTPALTSVSATGWATIPDLVVTDAASGQIWVCEYSLAYRATTGAGVQVRHKTFDAVVTNKLANPSFETGISPWTSNATATLSTATAGGGQSGASYLVGTVGQTGTVQIFSESHPATAGSVWSAAVYCRLGAGTVKTVRVDLRFFDAAGLVLLNDLGGNTTPVAGSWTRATDGATTTPTAPAGTASVGLRIVYLNAVAGDVVHLDSAQLEPSAPPPDYGATGGSGATGALAVNGAWSGLKLAATTVEDYSRRTAIRDPAVAGLTTQHGGLGATTDADLSGSLTVTIGGTGLTSQRIELEMAQRVTDAANATSLVAAAATFARVA